MGVRMRAKNSNYSPRVQEIIQQIKDDKLYVDSDANARILDCLTKDFSITERFYVNCTVSDEADKVDPEMILLKKYLRKEAIIAWVFVGLFVSVATLGILGIIWYNDAVKAEAAHSGSSISHEADKW